MADAILPCIVNEKKKNNKTRTRIYKQFLVVAFPAKQHIFCSIKYEPKPKIT